MRHKYLAERRPPRNYARTLEKTRAMHYNQGV